MMSSMMLLATMFLTANHLLDGKGVRLQEDKVEIIIRECLLFISKF